MKKRVIFASLLGVALTSFALTKARDTEQERTYDLVVVDQKPTTEPFIPVSKCSRVYADGRVAKCVTLSPDALTPNKEDQRIFIKNTK